MNVTLEYFIIQKKKMYFIEKIFFLEKFRNYEFYRQEKFNLLYFVLLKKKKKYSNRV